MVPPGTSLSAARALADGHLRQTSDELLHRARTGDKQALDALVGRYVPLLRRWASGRLPRWARDIADTHDLIQDVLLQTVRHIDGFQPQGESALLAYLRQSVLNRIRLELRCRARRPRQIELDSALPSPGPSPHDRAAGSELLADYASALSRLDEGDQLLVASRIEQQLGYQAIAEITGRPNANAARSAVVRALLRLADEMRSVA